MQIQFRWLLALMLLLAANHAVHADNADPKYMLTDPNNSDPDFALQGEYWGHICIDQASQEFFGLQVVALGKGQFDAKLLPGGLPGNGWVGNALVTLSGERKENVLTLVGSPYSMTVHAETHAASVRKSNDESAVGTLTRVTRVSSTMGARVPSGGGLLFGGGSQYAPDAQGRPLDLAALCWQNAKTTDEGLLLSGTKMKNAYQDFRLHVEYRVPFIPNARGQSRANSGVYLNSHQEVQILDSFGLAGQFNEAGSLYRFKQPDINMALPPLSWQTYDIGYQGARFDAAGKKTLNTHITVMHNGVVVQNNVEIDRPTGAGAAETPTLLPTNLQDHGSPVVFRNIWIAPLDQQVCCPKRKRK